MMNLVAVIGLMATITASHTSARVVDRYSVQFATPTTPDVPSSIPVTPNPPGGPYAGNGDVTVMFTGNSSGHGLDWQQWLHLSKNDMWGSDQVHYYPHLSAGRVGFLVNPTSSDPSINGTVSMFPGNASLVSVLTDSDSKSAVSSTTRVFENNAVVTTIECTSPSSSCPVTLHLSDTNGNFYGVEQQVGSASDGTSIWWRKENLNKALNPAYLGSCDAHYPLQSTERRFSVDSATGFLQMANGSCLWLDTVESMITSGTCTAPNGAWMWKGNRTTGDIVHTASSQCLTSGLSLGACGTTPWMQLPANDTNASLVYLSAQSGCIVVVPDNNNNTLGVAVGIADASGNLVKGTASQVSPTNPSAGITLSMTLEASSQYTLIVGLQTLRDIGCAGIRSQWEGCTTSPQEAATSLVEAMSASSARSTAQQTSETFWAGFWSASEVDLTSNTQNASTPLGIVERWYYLSQYLLGCTTRDGKVTSALDGFVCVEPVAWGDQFTLDYNLEATFWGAGSSNRLEFIHPVMTSTTNPGARATAQLRAQNPGTWNPYNNPSSWPGHVGSTVPGAACSPHCPNLTATGFKGAEWPSAGMPLGDNRLAASDLQTRFIGGLLSTNLIQYWEYSRNVTVLRDTIYEFVKDNAEFYLSYTTKGSDGKLVFPYSCAQEGCACRDAAFVKVPNVPVPNFTTSCKDPQSPMKQRCPGANGWMLNHPCYECYPDIATGSHDGYHNAHPDVAFASYSFRNAARFARILGIDLDRAVLWEAALNNMPDYPSANFTFVDGAVGSEFNGGAGFFVEAQYGYQPGILPNGSTTVPVTWPWCNKEYPIANFAAMWPTDEIGATQTTDKALLAMAKQTIFGLNDYQAKPWANVNGFCLSWPPAVRVSGKADSERLIGSFSRAITSTTGNNGCVHNHGGMLENIGATVAINDLLLQSHGDRMRFFPAWNATALGPASFTTLRAYGAFLVSASINEQDVVSPITVLSEMGSNAIFESPWPGTTAPKIVDAKGATVPSTTVIPGVFNFSTAINEKYTISAN